ncbi:hypothetical protein [Reyranella massiliensis]|uniref:hypothetical protein n=1 Tax=Reyranella massiliensis TaxID=445220 RepID=UPI0002FB0D33|nr:hypothetical protein [Reyranella massiliensis]
MNPLPSLIRASAWDAGNHNMHNAGRSKWDWNDFTVASAEHERLVGLAYARPNDQRHDRYIRFQIAEQMEQAGLFTSTSLMTDIHRQIDQAMASLNDTARKPSSAANKQPAARADTKSQPAALFQQ